MVDTETHDDYATARRQHRAAFLLLGAMLVALGVATALNL